MKGIFILWTCGLIFPVISAQILTTKCLSGWTKYKEKCYLIPGYRHSWHRSQAYCEKYGANLVQPKGVVINEKIRNDVSAALTEPDSFWTGYYRPDNTQPASSAQWSNGAAASVEEGWWGQGEPNIEAGQYAFVSVHDSRWYMGNNGTVRNFVCEMNPCPSGTRDTYMCNGKCLSNSVVCNGIDDCGNNQDENNCATVPGRDCTTEYEGNSGTINLPTTNVGHYRPNIACSWTIKTSADKRIVLEFMNMQTEQNTDIFEIWDGGLTRSSSQLAARWSGPLSGYSFTSSYNFVTVGFVSDATVAFPAGSIAWKTDFKCGYDTLSGYSYSNGDIVYDSEKLPTIKTTQSCKEDCNATVSCTGFRYVAAERKCYFINKLPVLEMSSGSELWMKTCYGGTTVQGGIPLLPKDQVATTSPKQLPTPLYPNPYPQIEQEYTITVPANNLITLKVLYLDLCCDDYIYIYDKDRDLLERLTSGSTTDIIISTGNTVHIKMDLYQHWKCNGALIQYEKGCDVNLVGSGTIRSPGFGTSKGYPDLMECTWSIHAPSVDRSVTLVFEDFDLQDDILEIAPATGSVSSHTGTSLNEQSRTYENSANLTMTTGSRNRGQGLKVSFSPGCPVLTGAGYVVSPQKFDFGDRVNLSCAAGFMFMGENSQQSYLTLTCQSGGHWSMANIPACVQGKCGHAPFISNGFITSSSGSVGGSVTEYMCNANYTLQGSASITCKADGSWEESPRCVSTLCPSISNLAPTTDPEVLLLDGVRQGSVVELTCDEDEEIIGAQTVQCNNGSFDFVSGTSPSFCNPLPCETPVVDNAVLMPEPAYVLGQEITAMCVEGYIMEGLANFSCGGNDSLPKCLVQNCSLDDFDQVVPGDGFGQTEYSYGDDVNVTCEDGYVLEDISSSHMVITCLHTGEWSHAPTCGEPSCGEPFAVPGSVYVPAVDSVEFCFEHGCNFIFQCRERYRMFGNSSFGDNTVSCGAVYYGLHDLGDLRCIGGQCEDPGYPASGELVGTTFEEGSTVTFRCNREGYQPLVSSGEVSEGMTCVYNETSKKMEWVGEMPVCNDTQIPTVSNCGDGNVRYKANYLIPLISSLDPDGSDNNALKEVEHYPPNTWLHQPYDELTIISYTFTDFHGNSKLCTITVTIPTYIECKNDESTNIVLSQNMSVSVENYVEQIFGGARITYQPAEVFSVQANMATLNTIFEADITAFNGSSNEILDQCTIQLKFVPTLCATWAFEISNGSKSCSGFSCSISCDNGFYFMESPTTSVIQMTCDGSAWDREPPVCAQSTQDYRIFKATYEYKYNVQTGVSDSTDCVAAYLPLIQGYLHSFAAIMTTRCNENVNVNNPLNVTLVEESTYLEFSLATKRLTVRFEFLFTVRDETLNGTTSIKQTCADGVIQSKLNTQQDIQSIQNLDSVNEGTLDCGSGVYTLASTTTQYGYDCIGYRRFHNTANLCLDCPKGHYYDSTTEPYNCKKCPAGTYGVLSALGAMCQTCPDNKNTGLTGQTNVSSCYFKEACPPGYFSSDGLKPCTACPIGYYRTDPYGRSCSSCGTNKVTYTTASTEIGDCKSLENAEDDNAVTPCTPDNPCRNGGTCGFVRSDYNCTCPPGYTGRTCETIFNLCTSNPCENGRECQTTAGRDNYTCICTNDPFSVSELTGDRCQIDSHGCGESFCSNNGTCHNQFQSHSCKCSTYSGYENADGGTCSTEIEPCEVDPICQNGRCIPNSHYYKTCDCDPGWTGIYCDNNIDDCDPDYCENGATCMDAVNSFTCSCAESFHGPYCQFRRACVRECDDQDDEFCHTCNANNTEVCVNVNNDFMCSCVDGYEGRSCEVETSLCRSYPCQHGGTCTAVEQTSYSCECMPPWTGDQCEMQINHCPNGEQCYNGGTCYTTSSGYRCMCPENYIGLDCSVEYDLCMRANPCMALGSNCSFSAGDFECICPTGYMGDYCESSLPSCADNICKNGGTCSDSDTGATCTCPSEFTGDTCDTEIDACSTNPCPAKQECVSSNDQYSCICKPGYRGQFCNTTVGDDFDYVITPMELCRDEASVAMFGDGVTDIYEFTIAFWARYKSVHGSGDILHVFGSKSGGTVIPSSPDFELIFHSTGVDAFIDDTSVSRRKRETENLEYNLQVTDGYWHHFVVMRSRNPDELNLYVDGEIKDGAVFSENNPVANIGFLVFGEINPETGKTNPGDSFEGLISRVYVLGRSLSSAEIAQLYSRSSTHETTDLLLYQERTLMLMYPVNYNSELNINRNKCLPSDTSCKGLAEVADIPAVNSCPTDTFVVTERDVKLNWTDPVFGGSSISTISNYPNGGSAFDFGIHGIIYASFDAEGDATTCIFRLFYSEASCGDVDGDNADCDDVVQGGKRCSGNCLTNQLLAGSLPLYQTCSMYGMWDKAVKYTAYLFPQCAAATDVTQMVSLELTAVPSNGSCENIKEAYSASVLNKLNQLNDQTNKELCQDNCVNVLIPAFTCNGNAIMVSIDFDIVSSTMAYGDESVTTEELLKIAAGDQEVFDYMDPSGTRVSLDLPSFSASTALQCEAGYMVSSGKCVLCGEGTYYDAPTMSCKRCAVGTYRSDLTDVTSSCADCHPSRTTPTDGATNINYCITKCVAGQYYEIPSNPTLQPNDGTCKSCSVGYYQDDTSGTIACKACPVGLTTGGQGSTGLSQCVTSESLTTTTTTSGATPDVGAATEGGGLSVGVTVAVVLGVVFVLALIILIICFCCCKELLPCLAKKKQVVSPAVKDGYYAKKYGDLNMHFVSYNLQDVREKKGKPLDRVPFVEPQMSDETGSVKTDISVHVPVFIEKMDGKVKRKSLYISNGGQSLNASLPRSGRTPRDPVMTSSPREIHYQNEMERDAYVQPKQKRRRKQQRKERSSSEKRSRRRYEEDTMEPVGNHAGVQLPKALAPMSHRLVSKPPANVILRASSPLEQPRVQVLPSQYEDFLDQSPTRGHQSGRSPRSSRSRDNERSRSRRRPKSYEDDEVESRQHYSGDYYEEEQPQFHIKRIEVESDEDLR